jgi:hypothetical protein
MKLTVTWLMIAALFLVPGMAAAQATGGAPASPQAQQESQPQGQPQAQQQPQAGPGPCCPMMSPEQMKQMQGKMGQCCMMPGGKGCPMCQQVQKQLDELSQRVDALEGKKKLKKK